MPIAETIDRGRCYIVDRDLELGEIILQEDPLQAVLHDEQVTGRCHHTFQEAAHLLRCGGCQWARYQSRDAQKAAWADGHKQECAALRAHAPHIPPASVRLAARVFWSQHRRGQRIDALPGSVQTLLHHLDKLSEERKVMLAMAAMVTREYMAGVSIAALPEPRAIVQLLACFLCNNHTICDEEQRPIGIGLFLQGAMLNHSCRPNAVQSFAGCRIIFRAISPIPEGAEATIAYVELAATREERRAELLDSYHFDIDAGQAAHKQAPLASATRADGGLIEVLAQPPHQTMTAADAEMIAVQYGAASTGELPVGGSGVSARVRQPPAASASFDLADDEGVDEHTLGLYAKDSGTAGAVVDVQCWGPPFWTGAGADMGRAEEAARLLAVAVDAHRSASQALARGQPLAAVQAAASALEVLDAPRDLQLGRWHMWRMRVLEVQMLAAVDEGNQWDVALAAARRITPFHRCVYPEVWPTLGLHLAMVGKAAALLGQFEEASAELFQAVGVLCYTHPDSKTLKAMQQLHIDVFHELGEIAKLEMRKRSQEDWEDW